MAQRRLVLIQGKNRRLLDDYYGEVALATLPRDRWGALGLTRRQSEGSVWSAPITLPAQGCRLSLNAQGAHGISVEIADERFQLLDGYHGPQSGRVRDADGLDCPVDWPAGDLRPWRAKPSVCTFTWLNRATSSRVCSLLTYRTCV